MRRVAVWSFGSFLLALFLGILGTAGPALAAGGDVNQPPVAAVSMGAGWINFQPHVGYQSLALTVSGPGNTYIRKEFGAGVSPALELAGLPDGSYAYELRVTPIVDEAARSAMQAARESGADEAAIGALRDAGLIPPAGAVQSGYFSIRGGAVVPPAAAEGAAPATNREDEPPGPGSPAAVVLTNADGVIRNSACVGFDCPDSPLFDDSTILLMENNTRIKFGDTSNSPFPNSDWEIEANSNLSGGQSYLGFNDCGTADNDGGCANDLVFAVEAGARQNALYVEDDGDVGLGTSLPVLDLHIVTGNTPSLRLDQDGSSGFAPQVWDIGGNEANFFIRDVTSGSRLPLRIRPGAPTSSIDISSTGNVGINTAAPNQLLHVKKDNPGDVTLLKLENNTTTGGARFAVLNAVRTWTLDTEGNSGDFRINDTDGTNGTGGPVEFRIDTSGNLTIAGALMQSSDFNAKKNITPVDSQAILDQVAALPISTWQSKTDDQGIRHLGPMAQDFHAAFGLGADDTHLAISDTSGVALAAIQGLYQELQEKNARLEARLAALEAKLAAESQPAPAEVNKEPSRP